MDTADRVQKLKDARAEAEKEIAEYKAQKDAEYESYAKEVRLAILAQRPDVLTFVCPNPRTSTALWNNADVAKRDRQGYRGQADPGDGQVWPAQERGRPEVVAACGRDRAQGASQLAQLESER